VVSPASSHNVDWIAADWGTSNLRIWALDAAGGIVVARSSDKGMGRLAPTEFEPALLELVDDLLRADRATRVIISGMAGARQGWIEAPYVMVPCMPASRSAVEAPTLDPRLSVRILPGLSQAVPPDVMRGEETQIAGFLASEPDFDGVACLPGTHTKWVRVRTGQVREFRTAMTGELFALLSQQSVLRHSMGQGWEEPAFLQAVNDAVSKPQKFAAALFAIRAGSLLAGLPPAAAKARLSGLLIGMELAATSDFWMDRPVVLIGDPQLSALYAAALRSQGAETLEADAETLTLEGLKAARRALNGETT